VTLAESIQADWLGGPDGSEGSGALYLQNTDAELLVFNNRNDEMQFGLPYRLAGRIDLPYADAYGLDREDDLVLVANGHGGVQVLDISNVIAPYHVGVIKPSGFSRDVLIHNGFAYIAASHQGVVVADLTDPYLPILARWTPSASPTGCIASASGSTSPIWPATAASPSSTSSTFPTPMPRR
jgi:hypothetical protein